MFLFDYTKKAFVKYYAVIAFVLITLSTLFVKQHYVLDAVASSIIGVSMYVLFTSEHIWNAQYVRKLLGLLKPDLAKKISS